MNSTNHPTRAVLWDLDSTLIDSMPYHWEAWNDILGPLCYHFDVESFKPTIGLRNEEIVRDFHKLDFCSPPRGSASNPPAASSLKTPPLDWKPRAGQA